MKKQYFLTIDTETTQDQLVADFAAVITDRDGNILNQCAILVDGIFTDYEKHPLFFDSTAPPDALWSKSGADRRYAVYQNMVNSGQRMVASVNAVNGWLNKAILAYNPALTAYNLAFDRDKCIKTGIDLTGFKTSFCLWYAAYAKFAHTKKYRQFALDVHAFNAPTKFGNMSFKTNAETMARFVLGNPGLEDEPHTALEDIIFYELPILNAVIKRRSISKVIESAKAYNWRECQVKDWFKAK